MIALERADVTARVRLQAARTGWTIDELSHHSHVTKRSIRAFLSGKGNLSLRSVRALARTLKTTTAYLMGRPEGDPGLAFLMSLMERPGPYPEPNPVVPIRPQTVTLLTDRIAVIRWTRWCSRAISASEIRDWNALQTGARFRGAKLELDGVRFWFEDRRNVLVPFDVMLGVWGPDERTPPLCWHVDPMPELGIVRIMKNGSKQRRMAKKTRRSKPVPAPIEQIADDEWVSTRRAAKILDVHEQTIRAYVRKDILVARKLGPRLWRISAKDLKRALRRDGPQKA